MSEEDTHHGNSTDDVSSVLPGFLARSFLAKFAVALLLVSVVIVGVSANTYAQTTDQLTDETRTEYIGVADQSATQIAEWQTTRSDTTRRLARFQVIQSGTQAERQSFLVEEQDRLPDDVTRVLFVDPETSNVTAASDPTKVGESLSAEEAPWQNGTVSYGEDGVFVSEATNALQTSLVSYVTPVETGDGQRLLVMQTDLNALAGTLPTPSAGVYSQVVDSQGRIVAGTRDQGLAGANAGSLPEYSEGTAPESQPLIVRGVTDGESGFLQDDDLQQSLAGEYVVAFAPVAGQDWVVATHVPIATAYELRSTVTQSLLILSATAFLGIGVIGLVFGRGTVSALNRLTNKAEQLEQGNLDIDLEATRADEFGRLTASFANMRDALRDRIQEAESARKEAEVSRSEALAMTEHLEEKAEDYSEVMRRCANGDLTQRLETDGENDAMDTIAEEFNDMLAELEKTTGQLKTFSEEVADSSDVVLTNTEKVRRSAESVTDSIDTISDDASVQQERLERLADDLDQVLGRLHSLKGNPHVDVNDEIEQFEAVADVLAEAAGKSERIRTEAESASERTKQQAEELDEVSERADRLKRYAKPLGGILERFETAAEHEFVFSGGPSQAVDSDDD